MINSLVEYSEALLMRTTTLFAILVTYFRLGD